MFHKGEIFQSEVTETINNFIDGDFNCRVNNHSRRENQELTSSAQQLDNVAGELQSIVVRFKTDQGEDDLAFSHLEEPEHPSKKEKRKTLLV